MNFNKTYSIFHETCILVVDNMKNKIFLATICLIAGSQVSANIATASASLPQYKSQEPIKASSSKDDKGIYGNSTELKIVKLSDSVKVTAAKATLMLLVGGSLAGTSKEQLKGSDIINVQNREKLKNPLFDISKNTANYKKEIVSKYPFIGQENSLNFFQLEPTAPYWSLIYDNSDKTIKKGYSLNFGAETSSENMKNKKKTAFQWYKKCSYKSEPHTLEAWEANDFQLVSEYREKIVEECTGTFKNHLDQAVNKLVEIDTESKRIESVLSDNGNKAK